MASLIENMITILEEEELLHEQLIEIAREKTGIIIKNDVDALQQLTVKEQNIMEQILPLEKKREECTKDISIVLNKPFEGITVRLLIDMMEGKPEIQKRLANIHDNFMNVLKDLRTLNERNSMLIKESLDLIQFDLNLYTAMRQTPMTADYDKSANNVGMHMISNSHGHFDKKQ
ncbi:MAG: flagellar protein FlgN [Lachnospiraceae bacterium]|nr:flagellar protein FlgN [Lachnospiraceae bacterium]